DPLPVDSGVDDHARPIQDGTMHWIGIKHANRQQPFCPVLAAVQMDQRKLEDIYRLGKTAATRQKLRTANGEELFATQVGGIGSGPIAVSMPRRHVDFLTREVDVMQRGGDTEVDAGMCLGKMAKAMHEPFGGEIRRGADR